jgi:hypothetical protein
MDTQAKLDKTVWVVSTGVREVVMVGTPRMSVRGLGWRMALRPTP